MTILVDRLIACILSRKFRFTAKCWFRALNLDLTLHSWLLHIQWRIYGVSHLYTVNLVNTLVTPYVLETTAFPLHPDATAFGFD